MENHYAVLGLPSSATIDEIRRAYRILARRYHPDVNPGGTSEEKFKKVAEAYGVLSDIEKRKQYDLELEQAESNRSTRSRAFSEYARAARYAKTKEAAARRAADAYRPKNKRSASETRGSKAPPPEETMSPIFKVFSKVRKSGLASAARRVRRAFRRGADGETERKPFRASQVSQISIIEVSLTINDAIRGVRKTVEINEGTFVRKISVTIPAGVRNGSVVRFRQKNAGAEEVVIITRVAQHPSISMSAKGIIVEVPITVHEALSGTKIQIPGLDEPIFVTVEPGAQSGTEIRIRDRGTQLRDGTRGDLFVRLMIKVPTSPDAVGLKEKGKELEAYYGESVRRNLPKSLFEL